MNSDDNHDLKGERPADEDAGVDIASVALLEFYDDVDNDDGGDTYSAQN